MIERGSMVGGRGGRGGHVTHSELTPDNDAEASGLTHPNHQCPTSARLLVWKIRALGARDTYPTLVLAVTAALINLSGGSVPLSVCGPGSNHMGGCTGGWGRGCHATGGGKCLRNN